jgi:hypothetical protein
MASGSRRSAWAYEVRPSGAEVSSARPAEEFALFAGGDADMRPDFQYLVRRFPVHGEVVLPA